ncbi:MAG TPA: hypothetical protein VF676_11425 [Flavobacterium sp.]
MNGTSFLAVNQSAVLGRQIPALRYIFFSVQKEKKDAASIGAADSHSNNVSAVYSEAIL